MRYLICNGFLVAKGPMRLANIIGIPSTLDPFQNFDEPRMRLISGSPVVVLLASPSCTLYSSFPPSYWFGCCIGRLKRLDHANLLLVHNNRHIQRKRLALDALLFILGKHILPRLRRANRDSGGLVILRRHGRILSELVFDHDGRTPAGLAADGCQWGNPVRSRDSKT